MINIDLLAGSLSVSMPINPNTRLCTSLSGTMINEPSRSCEQNRFIINSNTQQWLKISVDPAFLTRNLSWFESALVIINNYMQQRVISNVNCADEYILNGMCKKYDYQPKAKFNLQIIFRLILAFKSVTIVHPNSNI